MSSNRVYRRALDCDAIISELKSNSGTQFDPQIAAIAIDLLERGKMVVGNPRNPTPKRKEPDSPDMELDV
jgi:HD-GYP domain-containing protein (c-di-GMP phosphodiesterase class II)